MTTTNDTTPVTTPATLDDALAATGSLRDLLDVYTEINAEEEAQKAQDEQRRRERREREEREETERRQARLAGLLRAGLGDRLFALLVDQADLTVHDKPDGRGYHAREALPRATFALRVRDDATGRQASTEFTLLPMNAPHLQNGVELTLALLREERYTLNDGTIQPTYSTLISATPISDFRERLPRVLAAQYARLTAYLSGQPQPGEAAANAKAAQPPALADALRAYYVALAAVEWQALERSDTAGGWHGVGENAPRYEARPAASSRLLEMRLPAKSVAHPGQAASLTIELKSSGAVDLQRVSAPEGDRKARVKRLLLSVEEMATLVNEWQAWRDQHLAHATVALTEAAREAHAAEQAWLRARAAAGGLDADDGGEARPAEMIQEYALLRSVNLRTGEGLTRYPHRFDAQREALRQALAVLPTPPTPEQLESAWGEETVIESYVDKVLEAYRAL